jgi:hypothetical protein
MVLNNAKALHRLPRTSTAYAVRTAVAVNAIRRSTAYGAVTAAADVRAFLPTSFTTTTTTGPWP